MLDRLKVITSHVEHRVLNNFYSFAANKIVLEAVLSNYEANDNKTPMHSLRTNNKREYEKKRKKYK